MLPFNSHFFEKKKILITGHTGFKGSWLAIWLANMGAEVVGISLDPKDEKGLFYLSGIQGHIKDYREDIRNGDIMTQIFTQEQPEIVFHLAAQALVLEGYEEPVLTYETNVMGSVHVLEAIRCTDSVRSAVIITSDKCYENIEQDVGYKEEDAMGGFDPYSSSKGASELVIQAYRNSYFRKTNACGIASARSGNVVGGGDWAANRIIPDCVRAFENNEKVVLRNPGAYRPWQHVLDPLSGYLTLAEKLWHDPSWYSEAWNFGPEKDQQKTVEELVEKFIYFYGSGEATYTQSEKKHEAKLLFLDITKAKTKLNWTPKLRFEETMRLSAEWYLNYGQQNTLDLTLAQINEYSKQ